ncbi:MAG: hypothetical protein VW938_09785, partial [Synechococcus sp.]
MGLAGPIGLQAHAHGDGEGEELEAGEFRVRPVITIEGHGGLQNNLVDEGKPEHYAIDVLAGTALEWGLPNDGTVAIEAQFGLASVWGEAEHFYGLVHAEEHDDGHDAHGGNSGAPYRRTDL